MMDKSTTAASYTASIGTSLGGFLTANHLAIAIGIIFTIATFLMNWRYQSKKLALEVQKRAEDAEFHKARMNELLKQDRDPAEDNEQL